MNPFSRLWRWLTSHPEHIPKIGHPDDNPIDVARLASRLALEAEGQKLGQVNLPLATATGLCGPEAMALQLVAKARHGYLCWALERAKVLDRTIQSLDVEPHVELALDAGKRFEREADALLASRGPTLSELTTRVQSSNGEWEHFRSRHGLSREAVYPDTGKRFFYKTLLVLMVFFEGIVNAFFFAKGLDHGLIHGFLVAAVFSLFNVMAAYAWGRWGIPNLHHRFAWRRCLGGASLGLALGFALAIALMISHFRDALAHDLDNAARVALIRLLEAPLGLRDIQSWLLFGLSLLFAAAAMADAYHLDDPYPGYGKLARRLKAVRDDYSVEIDAVREALEELKKEALQRLDRATDKARTVLTSLFDAIGAKKGTEARLAIAASDAENCLDALLKLFRSANLLARRDPPPAYFSKRPPLKELPLPQLVSRADWERFEEQEKRVVRMQQSLVAIRSGIEASFNARHDSLVPLEVHYPPVVVREVAA